MAGIITDNNIQKLKKCFTVSSLNLNRIREELKIKRGNNTLRDFILGKSDDPGIMALSKIAEFANMDLMLVPIKKIDRLDSNSKQQEEELLKLIDSRFEEISFNLMHLTLKHPQKVSQQKPKKTSYTKPKVINNSSLIHNSLLCTDDIKLDNIFDDFLNDNVDVGTIDINVLNNDGY